MNHDEAVLRDLTNMEKFTEESLLRGDECGRLGTRLKRLRYFVQS